MAGMHVSSEMSDRPFPAQFDCRDPLKQC